MPLGLVSEVVAHGGYLPQLAELTRKKTVFNKKNGVVLSIFWLIFFTGFLTSFFGILGAPEELIALMAITGVFGSLMLLIGSLIFLRSSKEFIPNTFQMPGSAIPQGLHQPTGQTALPPQQAIPVGVYAAPQTGSWRDTNDLQPTTVTEGTTKLLDKDEVP